MATLKITLKGDNSITSNELLVEDIKKLLLTNYNIKADVSVEAGDEVLFNKTVSIEIDSEVFCDEIDYEHSSWSIDSYDIEDYPKILKYLQEFEPATLEALKNGTIDYIEVYRDV